MAVKVKGFLLGLLTATIVIAIGAGAYYVGTQSAKPTTQQMTTPTPTLVPVTPTTQAQPTQQPQSNVPAGWLTYKSQQHGFEISYPASYQALDDANNLYGWPNAVVLIYSGGQSYDLPIEVWNNTTDYQTKYSNQMPNLTVKQVGGKYISLLNANQSAEVDQIISTFVSN